MKVTCILGSPKPQGNTATIMTEILRGMGDIEVVKYCLNEETINYCTGCKTCYISGNCIHNDSVQGIVDDILHSHIVFMGSPSYWGDVTGQMKVFIDRCTPYGNTNSSKKLTQMNTKGIALAVRAGQNKKENENLIHTFEHFLGHLNIPLISSFTVEGIDAAQDLANRPEVLKMAYDFGKSIIEHSKLITDKNYAI